MVLSAIIGGLVLLVTLIVGGVIGFYIAALGVKSTFEDDPEWAVELLQRYHDVTVMFNGGDE